METQPGREYSRCSGVKGIPKIIPHPHPDTIPRAVTNTPMNARLVRVATLWNLDRNRTAIAMKMSREMMTRIISCKHTQAVASKESLFSDGRSSEVSLLTGQAYMCTPEILFAHID